MSHGTEFYRCAGTKKGRDAPQKTRHLAGFMGALMAYMDALRILS